MPWFEFEAKDRSGTMHKDRIEATDLRHAHHLLGLRHWFVLKIGEEGSSPEKSTTSTSEESKTWLSSLPKNSQLESLFAPKARRKQVPERTEQMAQLLRAGMRLSEVFGVMSRRSSDPAWQEVFEKLRSGVVSGKPLSEAMGAYPELFSSLFRAMVAAGEASGHLVEILERLAQYLQRREAIQQRLIGALIYPSIIVLAGLLTVVFFMVVMLPKLSGMFQDMGQALPWSTQLLIWSSQFLTHFGWLIPIAIFGVWWSFRNWIKNVQHRLKWDRAKLRWFLVGKLIALGEHSRFTQTLSTLLQSGVTLIEALQVAEATLGNTALRLAVREARIQVREGKSLNEALAGQKIFPGLMLDMLAVGERTGDLSGALSHTADAYERDLDRAIRTFTALIEPILIVLMAGFVGSIVLSVLMAVFDLTSGIGKM